MSANADTPWARAAELFHAAAELPASERAAFLAEACAGDEALRREVESLVEFDDPNQGRLGGVVRDAIADVALAVSADRLALERIGPYRLLSEIGSGGMGTVFLAERDDDIAQRVAIKIVRGYISPDTLRRFRSERRILAGLEHPYIARLIDGGTTPAGMPYLVMEFVDGVPVGRYCDERKLSVADRIALFLRVCEAVSFAHRSLIVHRDLKPSNILVTADGTPKLLDFGIAKLIDDEVADTDHTTPSMRVMTPQYASPEQVRGERITTASDVYSLGMLLFALLAGRYPYDTDSQRPDEIERLVCEQEPPKPSALAEPAAAGALRGDLDTIVLTALQKEPARRFASVDSLAEDLRRHLDGRPVMARPSTWRYRAGRFVRRNRAAVAAGVLFAATVAGFAVALVIYATREARERDAAERVTTFLTEMFSGLDPAQARGGNDATTILDRGAERAGREFEGRPEVRARVLDAIGSAYLGIGQFQKSFAAQREALASLEQSGHGDSLQAASVMTNLANGLIYGFDRVEAERLATRALEIRRRELGPRHPDVAASMLVLGHALDGQGRQEEAGRIYADTIAMWRETLGPNAAEAAQPLVRLAAYRREAGDFVEAERLARELLTIRQAAFGELHPEVGEALFELGVILQMAGRPADAEIVQRRTLALRRKLYGTDQHPFIVNTKKHLGIVLYEQGKLAEAEPILRDSLASVRAVMGVHGATAANLFDFGRFQSDRGLLDEAAASFRESAEIRKKVFAPKAPLVGASLMHLAGTLVIAGHTGEAVKAMDEAWPILTMKPGTPINMAAFNVLRANVLAALSRHDEAEALYRDALAVQRKALPPRHPGLIETSARYGSFLLDRGRAAEAEPLLRAVHDARQSLDAQHWVHGESMVLYGAALRARGRHAEADPLIKQGLSEVQAALPPGDPRVKAAISRSGTSRQP